MTEQEKKCPECNVPLKRKLGLPGVVLTCPSCREDWVLCLEELITLSNFHKLSDKWH